jgi:hypothetical protein
MKLVAGKTRPQDKNGTGFDVELFCLRTQTAMPSMHNKFISLPGRIIFKPEKIKSLLHSRSTSSRFAHWHP